MEISFINTNIKSIHTRFNIPVVIIYHIVCTINTDQSITFTIISRSEMQTKTDVIKITIAIIYYVKIK